MYKTFNILDFQFEGITLSGGGSLGGGNDVYKKNLHTYVKIAFGKNVTFDP